MTMHRNANRAQRSPGTISVRCFGTTELRSTKTGRRLSVLVDRYEYRAPSDVARSLGPCTRYTANAYRSSDDLRRFVPDGGRADYVARAFHIGLALLARERDWSKSTIDDYCVAKLAYDWLGGVRERLKPRKLSAEILVTPRRLRRDILWKDALPEELSEDPAERGSRLVNRIAVAGAAAARRRGILKPQETDLLALGLMEAAAAQPSLAATSEQIADLIHEALFDLEDDSGKFPQDVCDEVAERFEAAVRDRLAMSRDQFKGWLVGKKAYMLQTVERSSDLPGVEDSRELVRQVLLAEAWKGFFKVSECLDAFAAAFSRAVPRSLNAAEDQLFGVMYRRQPYFGNLVLPLLLDAKDLIKHAVLDLWDDPHNAAAIAVLQRMLIYRGSIISRVRIKERIARARRTMTTDLRTSEIEDPQHPSEWIELIGHILEIKGVDCPRCDLTPTCILSSGHSSTTSIDLNVSCAVHGPLREITITANELRDARRSLDGSK